MSEERVEIVVTDRVSEEPAKKIQFLATQARDAHKALSDLRKELTMVNAGSVRKLQQEMTRSTTETVKQATAIERLTAAQARSATAIARMEREQARANNVTAQGTVLQQKLATEVARTERVTSTAAATEERLTVAMAKRTSAMDRQGDAAVKLYNNVQKAQAAQNAANAQQSINALSGVNTGTSKSARASMAVFADDARQKLAAAKATDELKRSADSLRGSLDPAYAAQLQHNRTVTEATRLMRAGALSQTDYARVVAMSTQAMNANAAAHMRMADHTKLNRFQLLTLQYTVNDVVASLASGGNPLTILLQQGGQVTQAWGGLTNTLKAAAGAIFSTTGAVVALVAAGAGLLLFGEKVRSDFGQLSRMLEMTAASSGLTAGAFETMASRIAVSSDQSFGAAKEVAMQFVKSGGLQKEAIEQLSVVTLNFARITGESAEKVGTYFAGMAKGPADFALEHSAKFGKITTTQYSYIKSLEDTGKKTEAVAEMSRILFGYYGADAAKNLSFIGGLWQAMARDIDTVTAAMRRLFNTDSNAAKLKSAEGNLAGVQKRLDEATGRFIPDAKANVAAAQLIVDNLKAVVKGEEAAATAAAKTEQAHQKSNVAIKELAAYSNEVAGSYERGEKAVAKFRATLADAALKGAKDPDYLNALKNQSSIENELRRKANPIGAKAGDKAKKDEAKELRELMDLLAVGSGLTKNFAEQWDTLNAGRRRGILSVEQLTVAQKALLALQPAMIKEREQDIKITLAHYEEQQRLNDEKAEAAVAASKQLEQAGLGAFALEQATRDQSKAISDEIGIMGLAEEKRARAIKQLEIEAKLRDRLRAIADMDIPATEKKKLEGRASTDALAQGKNADAASTLDAMKELDKFFDPSKVETFGEAIKGAFGGASDAMTKTMKVLGDYMKATQDLGKMEAKRNEIQSHAQDAYEDGDMVKSLNLQAKATEYTAMIEKKRTNNQLTMYGDMIGAVKGYFDTNSKGYKALEVVQAAFAVAQAISNFAVGTSAAAAAIAQQGTGGDPYTAFARMAAMAASMASLGLAVAGFSGGGKSSGPSAAERQAAAGTGTVLGDAKAKSESITNLLDDLADNSKLELKYQSQMLQALRNIESSIGGLANIIIRTTGLAGGYQGSSKLGFLGNAKAPFGTSGALGSIWGKNTAELKDQGISFGVQSLAQVIREGGGIMGQAFADIETSSSSWFGLKKKISLRTEYSDLDEGLNQQFSRVIKNIVDTTRSATGALGLSSEEFNQRISAVEVNLGKISFKGLSGKEIQEQLTNVFSAFGDTLAEKAFPEIKAFQRVGEGFFETIGRVAIGVENAGYALEKFGITAVNFKDIENKQGDIGAEIFRESIKKLGTQGNLVDILQGVSGGLDDVADVYERLLTLQNGLQGVGKSVTTLTQAMIKGAGGLDKLEEGVENYFSRFFSAEEKAAEQKRRLDADFARIGVAVPTGMAGFRKLVDSIDTTTESGQRLFGQLMTVAGAFADVADSATEAADRAKEAANALLDINMRQLERSVEVEKKRLQLEFTATQQMLQAQIKSRQASVATIKQLSDALHDTLSQFATDETLGMSRQTSIGQIETALKNARQGVFAEADSLKEALSVIARPSAELFTSFIEYSRDFDKQAEKIAELSGLADTQLSVEERILKALEDQLASAETAYKAEVDRLDAFLQYWRDALDEARNGTVATLSVRQAVWDLAVRLERVFPGTIGRLTDRNNAMPTTTPTSGGGGGFGGVQGGGASGAPGTVGTGDTRFNDMAHGGWGAQGGYANAHSGVPIDVAAVARANYTDPAEMARIYQSLGLTQGQIATALGFTTDATAAWFAAGGVPAFAAGGIHSGGLRLVGERGMELEATGAARYYSAAQTADMMGGDSGVSDAINRMAVEANNYHVESLTTLKTLLRIFENWQQNGMPAVDPTWAAGA